ncbi:MULTISPECIES: flavodoxin family protein [unclassified Methanopyrus]|uniref:flavodoxin family protein n=1 Tax=unclassified Methanopyrus TaxID=2684913 RepID=UPI000B4C1480|nr:MULTISPECIES: flavodoxin family protein [unclassified Methanopyrus]
MILGISGSPREGNTEYLVRVALEAAEEVSGEETEFITVRDMDISPCRACGECLRTGECVIDDDMHDVYELMLECDGMIVGSPVYYGGVSAQLKALMDRTRPLRVNWELKDKVGGAIAVGGARNGGQEHTLRDIQNFFMIHAMIVVGDSDPTAHFGGAGVGLEPGDVEKDETGVETARNTGRRVGEVVKLIKGR